MRCNGPYHPRKKYLLCNPTFDMPSLIDTTHVHGNLLSNDCCYKTMHTAVLTDFICFLFSFSLTLLTVGSRALPRIPLIIFSIMNMSAQYHKFECIVSQLIHSTWKFACMKVYYFVAKIRIEFFLGNRYKDAGRVDEKKISLTGVNQQKS